MCRLLSFVSEFKLIFLYHIECGTEGAVLNNESVTYFDRCKLNTIGAFSRPLDVVTVGDSGDLVLGDKFLCNYDYHAILSFGVDKEQVLCPVYEKICEEIPLALVTDGGQYLCVGLCTFHRMETKSFLVLSFDNFACFPSVSVGAFDHILTSHKKLTIDDSHHHLELRLIIGGTVNVLLGYNVEIHKHLEERNLSKTIEYNVVQGDLNHRLLSRNFKNLCRDCLCLCECYLCHSANFAIRYVRRIAPPLKNYF